MKISLGIVKTKKGIAVISALTAIAGFALVPVITGAVERPRFASGNIVTANNSTSGNGQWSDPVNAISGEVVEFRIMAQNQVAGTTAKNVKISASCPGNPVHEPKAHGTVSADNADSVSDTATVKVTDGKLQGLAYIPGHVRVFDKSCPNGCAGSDNIVSGGIKVDDLGPGESAQVAFKCYVTNYIQPTPTPTASPTPSPSPSPTASPTPTPTVTVTPTPIVTVTPTPTEVPTITPTPPPGNVLQCPAGFVETISGSNIICVQQIQNQEQSQNNNQTINASGGSATTGEIDINVTSSGGAVTSTTTTQPVVVSAAAPPSVTVLPKTGLPLAAWGLTGLIPAGIGIKRFGRGEKGGKDSANLIWQIREFLKK